MFESIWMYGLVFFMLGFVAGLIVATLWGNFRTNLAEPSQRVDREPASPARSQPSQASLPSALPAEPPELSPPPPSPSRPSNFSTSASPPAWLPVDEPKRVKPDPLGSFLQSIQTSTLKEKPKPQTMAMEIDAILQEMLPESALAGRTIRLQDQPDFGLLVIVDGENYSGVGSVPDEAVRALIGSAVAEWQRRASPM